MFESQHLLDVQLVYPSASILRDLVDQHRDLGDWGIHPVPQAKLKWKRNCLEALCPVRLDLPIRL
jgi:hypothetical protein